ncbi:hypothetical protein VP01_4381g1 [Puccinia sorghi]|uniref:Uncharacterized protein n=1 Tax=Puccinia sorghi TaxID=27349 RepID=A0A0L6UPQ2_9BASI|nr:hypothetical protein VP01_4381g1 [Puccinia sorghi]
MDDQSKSNDLRDKVTDLRIENQSLKENLELFQMKLEIYIWLLYEEIDKNENPEKLKTQISFFSLSPSQNSRIVVTRLATRCHGNSQTRILFSINSLVVSYFPASPWDSFCFHSLNHHSSLQRFQSTKKNSAYDIVPLPKHPATRSPDFINS